MATLDDIVRTFPDTAWDATTTERAPTTHVEHLLEGGHVLCFPALRFDLSEGEQRFLTPTISDGKAKNISLRDDGSIRGASGSAQDQGELRDMIVRFSKQAQALVDRLFPHYRGKLRAAKASYRPMQVEGRESSWRKDDTRLHVDAFPSNPVHGVRLLRVFTNLNPAGKPRQWRVGEPFPEFLRRFAPRLTPPVPGSAALMRSLHITKSHRTPYDHYMLQLHDKMKADLAYQREAPQRSVDFAPGTTWVVFSDQVLHAVMGGQYMMEQTFYLEPRHQLHPHTAPLKVLEDMLGKALLPAA
ncbi:hypothetical protein GALL_433060 [mine drainage metagenome]|jgi:hypothetical protein|uniref:3-deoxy-D-manno-oct-2-ulosonic acid (Kdo) hydroxylase n=1 Tax=mine drainage metagenome TaxID=410659 RepID=A0A1J5QGD4_9ZZZZ